MKIYLIDNENENGIKKINLTPTGWLTGEIENKRYDKRWHDVISSIDEKRREKKINMSKFF